MSTREKWWMVGTPVEHRKTKMRGEVTGFPTGGNVGSGPLGAQRMRVKFGTGVEIYVSRKDLKKLARA